jgi:signal transduction histidine kinase
LKAIKRFLKAVPASAFALVLCICITNSLYLYFKFRVPEDPNTYKYENGQVIYDYIKPGSSDDKVGIRSGDILVAIDSIPIARWNFSNAVSARDSIDLQLLRDSHLIKVKTDMPTMGSNAPIFYWSVYLVTLLFNLAGLYILYKKPKDKTVRLFFIYLQLFSVTINAFTLPLPFLISVSATCIFLLSGLLMGPVLIHFHLLFPKPSRLYDRLKILPKILYGVALMYFIPYGIYCYLFSFNPDAYYSIYSIFDRIGLIWIAFNFFIAMAVAIFQFLTIKDTLSRNQIRMVIIGSFFGFITPMAYGFFYNLIDSFGNYSWMVLVPHAIGSTIMIAFILVAIFRYRIWDTEVFFRKALLYMGATVIITTSYLFLITLTEHYIAPETTFTRFIILAVSVIFFLLIRDWMQRRIDRLFQRESYDSATVVSNFEEKMAGAYRIEDLGSRILKGMDQIFHFTWIVLVMKREKMVYVPAYSLGLGNIGVQQEIPSTNELEERLKNSKVFAPAELENKPVIMELAGSELVVPILRENQPVGFFLCGPKKSEKTYSMQDISVLTLIAKRVIALFHTATLYQQDLDRHLMLERERARIAQDMHDDIGAGLTRIAMISEVGNGKLQTAKEKQMQKVATTAREMVNRLNVIVWALNPRYDNLDSLISYIRRYFGEYLESVGVNFRMDAPDNIQDITVTPDFRRNVLYACQEALQNAVKHGKCSEVQYRVKFDGIKMAVTISDNGRGFDKAKPGSGGNGMLNMQKRAQELGGTFEIESHPGKGTRVNFEIPVEG